jgi:hypothetical protein
MTGQSETKELSPILLLKSAGENLKWPILETSDNKTSLVCFTDKRKAQELSRPMGMHGYELRTFSVLTGLVSAVDAAEVSAGDIGAFDDADHFPLGQIVDHGQGQQIIFHE